MTPLEHALRERIQREGPVTVEAFMEACNAYYYATRNPLGAQGDFTTAPEISQMFGELVGAALADCWKRAGAPAEAIYAELGPGRATLALDSLRVMHSAGFSGEVHFVETSPVLREIQETAVPDSFCHEGIEGLPEAPLLLVANEFLDALPVRQHVGGIERHVTVAGDGLTFDRSGEITETSPARDQAVTAVTTHLLKEGGVALFIDYGHERSSAGDTLQAVRSHGFSPLLLNPGEQDLTSHVDFESVTRIARDLGALVTPVLPQGEWLGGLGIDARARALTRANPARAEEIETARARLVSDDQMGKLFKVIAVHSPRWPEPAGF